MDSIFTPADLLLPQGCDLTRWSVVACDQYTSQPEYWDAVESLVGKAPSTLRLILPERYLGTPEEAARIDAINASAHQYLRDGTLREYKDSFLYLERTLESGSVRRGLIGKIDLEAYDYAVGVSRRCALPRAQFCREFRLGCGCGSMRRLKAPTSCC
jgi:hypothetical protein